jgi:protein-disulfide isomerase
MISLTAAVLLLIFSFLLLFHHSGYEKPIPLYVKNQPTIGSETATVHVVSFEDPKCNNCIINHNQNFQKLYDTYIKTGLIRYTVYLVAELPHSNVIARMMLCVNHQSPHAFFNFLDRYYAAPTLALTTEELNNQLLQLAADSSLGINLDSLKTCTAMKTFENQSVANTNYARAIMGGVIKTPMIFVDGIRLIRPSYEQLVKLIELELKKKK